MSPLRAVSGKGWKNTAVETRHRGIVQQVIRPRNAVHIACFLEENIVTLPTARVLKSPHESVMHTHHPDSRVTISVTTIISVSTLANARVIRIKSNATVCVATRCCLMGLKYFCIPFFLSPLTRPVVVSTHVAFGIPHMAPWFLPPAARGKHWILLSKHTGGYP